VTGRLTRGVCAAALAAALSAPAALAQEIYRVRAGEHPAYTRLVVDGPVDAEYAWGLDGRRLLVVLRVPGAALDLAAARGAPGLSRVNGFAPEAAAGGAAFVATLGCDCGARAVRLDDGRFVLDIAEGAPRPAPPSLGEPVEAAPVTPANGVANASAAPAGGLLVPAPRPLIEAPAEAAPPETAARAPDAEPPEPAEVAAAGGGVPAPSESSAAMQPPMTARQFGDPDAPEHSSGDPVNGAPAGEESQDEARSNAQSIPRGGQTPQEPGEADSSTVAGAPDPEAEALAEAARTVAEEGEGDPEDETAPDEDTAQEDEITEEGQPGAPDAATIESARRRLLEQLTRAAEEGFLTFAPDKEPPQPEDSESAEDDSDRRLDARTALDIAQGDMDGSKKETEQPANCMTDARFDAEMWARDAPADLQIGLSRSALVREFDAPDARAVLAYARMLVRFGFGYEARAALLAFADTVAPPPELLDMAAVIDGDAPDAEGPLRQGVGCEGLHGAWALAASALAGDLDASAIEATALDDPMTRLPPNLRAAIAVPLAEAALAAGRIETASHVVTLAARSEPPPPDGDARVILLAARVDAARGDWRRAEAAIAPLIDDASPAGAEAMIRMVEFRLARGAAPPPGLADNMEAMAFSLGSSTLGRRLLAAAAQARAKGEGLALALSALKDLSRRGAAPGAAAAAARDMVVDYAPSPDESVAYAEAILDHLDLIGDGPESDRARIAAARRFTELGVGGLAEELLAPPLSRDDPAARLAAAEAALDSMAAPRALAYLDGLEGAEAARRRAAAHAALGDYAAAAAEAGDSGDAGLEARYAWLSGNWRAAAAAGDADRRLLAAWMAGEGAMPPELRAAAADDPALAARLDAFDPSQPALGGEPVEAAAEALDAARRRRAVMTEILGDG
jgi:hypothetical protein